MGRVRRVVKIIGPWRVAIAAALGVGITVLTAWWIALAPTVIPRFPFSRRPPHPNPTHANQVNSETTYYEFPEQGLVHGIVVSDHGQSVIVGSSWWPPEEWEETKQRYPDRMQSTTGRSLPLWVGGLWRAFDDHPNFPIFWYNEIGSGWPFTALVYRQVRDGNGNVEWTGAWHIPGLWQQTLGGGSVAPLSPAFPGFYLNTLLYGGLSYTLISCPAVYSGIRRRLTNRCTACGYSLDNLTADTCPECGGRVKVKAIA
jgi:hypothetical protein